MVSKVPQFVSSLGADCQEDASSATSKTVVDTVVVQVSLTGQTEDLVLCPQSPQLLPIVAIQSQDPAQTRRDAFKIDVKSRRQASQVLVQSYQRQIVACVYSIEQSLSFPSVHSFLPSALNFAVR